MYRYQHSRTKEQANQQLKWAIQYCKEYDFITPARIAEQLDKDGWQWQSDKVYYWIRHYQAKKRKNPLPEQLKKRRFLKWSDNISDLM